MNSNAQNPPASLYYLNPLFDLSFGNYTLSGLQHSAEEMSTLFIPVAGPSDKVLLDVTVPDDYWEYLSSCGLDCPQPLRPGELCNDMNGTAWGWNKESVTRLTNAGAQCNFPNFAIVKEANSRKFSYILNQKTETGVPGAKLIESMEQLHLSLESRRQFPLVIKPLFGSAGYGFIRKESAKLTDSEQKQAARFLGSDGCVIIEPWYTRLYDISTKCAINSLGNITDIMHHRTLSNRAGTFFANWIDPADTVINRWRDALDCAAESTLAQLHKLGYFGPVGFDSFVWEDTKGKHRLAAIIEINARHPMSSIAYALYDKLAPGTVSTFRFISKKRHRLPDNYTSLINTFGRDAFNKKTKAGIMLVTPMRLCHDTQWVQPARSAFFICAKTVQELFIVDERLRRILSR